MHLHSDGNNASLRASLGSGWGRALPSAFLGFDNCIVPDGANDELRIRLLDGQQMPSSISFTMWIKTGGSFAARGSYVITSRYSSKGMSIGIYINETGLLYLCVDGSFINATGYPLSISSLYFIAISLDLKTKQYKIYVNGVTVRSGTGAWSMDPFANPIQSFGLFAGVFIGSRWNYKTDELTLYNRVLIDYEVMNTYNAGNGGNPTNTEGIIYWYDFNKAESGTDLYPDGLPAGWTPGAWGIRDKSPNNYHGQQLNFSANNSTLGGAIQTF